jgi:uncharacterized damage-inducible protein DinB
VDDEAWLRRLLEGSQRALAQARETNPHELQPLIDDLERLCDTLERRVNDISGQTDDAPAPTAPPAPPTRQSPQDT